MFFRLLITLETEKKHSIISTNLFFRGTALRALVGVLNVEQLYFELIIFIEFVI